jgi:hypothetical protein
MNSAIKLHTHVCHTDSGIQIQNFQNFQRERERERERDATRNSVGSGGSHGRHYRSRFKHFQSEEFALTYVHLGCGQTGMCGLFLFKQKLNNVTARAARRRDRQSRLSFSMFG